MKNIGYYTGGPEKSLGKHNEIKSETNIDLLSNLGIKIEEINPESINETEFRELKDVVNVAFGIQMSEDDIKNHIVKSNKVFLIKLNGKIIAFSSIIYFKQMIYRFGTAIHKKYQGKGLYKELTEVIGLDSICLLRTQNKNIINSLKSMGLEVLIGKEAQDFLTEKENKGGDLNNFFTILDGGKNYLSNGIFKGVYGQPLGNEDTVNFITENDYNGFDYKKGDALLVVYYKKT